MDINNKELIINLIGDNSYNYVVSHVLGNSSNIVDPYRHSNSESISTSVTYDRIIEGETEILYELNKYAAESLSAFNPSAATDITGFGLLGHAYEMASGSEVSFEIDYSSISLLPGTKELAEKQIFPAGSRTNHTWLKDVVDYGETISPVEELILCDSITSGGLFISLPEDEAVKYVQLLEEKHSIEAKIIGKVTRPKHKSIYVK